jgi:pyruvate-ferredoxin/flavodoxin oxidoreductase
MWFRKSKPKTEPRRQTAEQQALDGHAAALAVASMACEAVVIRSDAAFAEITGPFKNLVPHLQDASRAAKIRPVTDLKRLVGMLVGQAASGLRTAGFVDELDGAHEALRSAAGKRLPCVISLTARAGRRQAGSLHGGHDDYHAVADAGLFQLFARNVQEVADLGLIAHRIAELALIPGVCAQDFYRTSQSVQNIQLPQRELIVSYLGRPDDRIEGPTPAQRILFGEQRRRIPRFIDPDHPAGLGGVQDQESFFRAVAAQRPFFAEHLSEIVTRAMLEFGELTGRRYDKVAKYRVDDADVVVLAQGAVVEELHAVTDYLRQEKGVKAGVLNLTLLRPFPGAELTQCLQGKRAVTVLERTDTPLAGDGPLLQEVRSAIDKALENGSVGSKETPYPAYARYRGLSDRPQLYSGIYAVGTEIPAFDELIGVFSNMLPDGAGRRHFYVGVDFGQASRRFPHLQSLQQTLNKAYPHLPELSLPRSTEVGARPSCQVLRIHALSVQGGLFAGNLFARLLAGALDWRVRTIPSGGLERHLVPSSVTLLHGEGDLRSQPITADVILFSSGALLESLASGSRIEQGGTAIVASNAEPEVLWAGLSRRTERWIRDHAVRLFALDARKIAAEAASQPAFIDQLSVWSLLGAYLQAAGFSESQLDQCDEHLATLLGQLFGHRDPLLSEIATSLRRGRDELVELSWQSWAPPERTPTAEPEPPWTVQHLEHERVPLFDQTRFWHSVAYLYHSGQSDEALADPFLATGLLPAGTSAHRDMTTYRLQMPQWLPENCTGCGLCWAHCPDSALPPTIQDAATLVDTGMTECKRDGATMIQMARISGHLAKQAHRLAAKDGMHQYLTMGPLLQDSFEQLVEKMGLDGDALSALTEDFELLRAKLEYWPFAKTEGFFDAPDKLKKGSGLLLSINLNPLACKGCGLCIEVCPDGALAWAEQNESRVDTESDNWALQMKLPNVPDDVLDKHLCATDTGSQVNRLLDRNVYHSMVGGDVAFPGSSVKTAVHLLTAATESVMQARHKAHVDKLSQLIAALQAKIQGQVADVVQINDFAEFAARLSKLDDQDLTLEKLGTVFGDGKPAQHVDQAQLSRLSKLVTELEAQLQHYAGDGAGRARMLITLDPDGDTLWSGAYPDNPHASPWLSHTSGDAPALAEGVIDGITRRLAAEMAACRLAGLELRDAYDPAKAETIREQLDGCAFTDEEWQLVPPLLVLAQPGRTRWEDITSLLDTTYPLLIALLDTDGIRLPSDDEGETGVGSDFGLLALARGDAYVVQTSVGNPGHLIRGVTESLKRRCPALFQIYAPDPHANGIATDKVAEQAQKAYQSRGVPLFAFDPDLQPALLSLDGNPEPGADWAPQELIIKEPSGLGTSLVAPLTLADWAIGEARFRGHFEVLAKGHLNDQMTPLSEYVTLEPAKRDGLTPYINITDARDRQFIASVSPAMTAATEKSRAIWTHLCELAGRQSAPPDGPAPETPPARASSEAIKPASAPDASAHQALSEQLLWLCGYGRDPEFFKQSLREFVMERAKEPEA